MSRFQRWIVFGLLPFAGAAVAFAGAFDGFRSLSALNRTDALRDCALVAAVEVIIELAIYGFKPRWRPRSNAPLIWLSRLGLVYRSIAVGVVVALLSPFWFNAIFPLGGHGELAIVTLRPITPRSGPGVGYDIVIENGTDQSDVVTEARFEGQVKRSGARPTSTGVPSNVSYEVDLDTSSLLAKGFSLFGGTVSEGPDFSWGAAVTGTRIVRDDNDSYESSYSLRIPLAITIAASQPAVLRILFKESAVRQTLSALPSFNDPSDITRPVFASNFELHTLTLKFASGNTLPIDTGGDLFEFMFRNH